MKQALFFSGRELTDEEIPILSDVHSLAVRPGLSRPLLCHRCGNTSNFSSHPCARCGTDCAYCRNCIQMGKISSCTTLYRWIGPEPAHPKRAGEMHWSGTLSAGQKKASQHVQHAVENNLEHTVWAVAGAGKTEVLFGGIAEALQNGKRVCIAAPRADVVRELAPRLQSVFPDTPPAVLYGGSPDRHTYSPLVIATTHQLLRFFEAFDVMIVDEVDAFPYTFDASLQFAVQKARKQKSSLIYLTATPELSWQEDIHSGRREATLIPARYHRHPLPVPEMKWCGNWKKSIVPVSVLDWLKGKEKALLFYPHIETMDKALLTLKQVDARIQSVHAEDPLRKEKVEAMRRGEIPVLLTTTILERGVTFPGVDVAVVGAEDRIFTESALVQIAGRAGRSADCPTGIVTFFHYGKTNAMVRAISQITRMNKLGEERGLLDV
ncbi:DEAD/DEAH box helicase [Domibacillus sp. DTU_2020_1001157_1_SI_ALB_TIR_016]|uniref:DEAD/DEAH box helicase n=1 Tax=Domibacillus sp. DTU_2020_1001157_1_SI_ALB_TIR_016 TaxID=3077789 RepID=UPI0028EF3CB4|nr:DEAD/DEAH box helicase [Domibacillus sp. DTU_2020_1001157_1_SI_ALB_TIR_016]WNS81287.1 DEAD/DEAH box helicase [Domibacillus sp. DTU_2020_1001157_1_SI_ALB_TIR_016]